MNKLNEEIINIRDEALSQIEGKDWMRARTVNENRIDAMLHAITNERKLIGRVLAIYFYYKFIWTSRDWRYPSTIRFLNNWLQNQLSPEVINEIDHMSINDVFNACRSSIAGDSSTERYFREQIEWNNSQQRTGFTFNEDVDLNEEDLEETYSEEELKDFVGKTFNQQKIQNIYRRTKYNDSRLYAHTKCTKCGREKRVFLSNLVNDPEKYGSCVCSDANLDGKYDKVQGYYDGSKKLSNNTSGFTGVSKVKTKTGNKWRAYIDTDGERKYLGDFTTKSKAIDARQQAAEKGIKWYKEHKNQFKNKARRKAKRYKSKRFGNKK